MKKSYRIRVLPLLFMAGFVLAITSAVNVSPVYATTFTVDSASDAGDANPGDGVCATNGGDCTFRAAIEETNAKGGYDKIRFDIRSGDGSCPPAVTIYGSQSSTYPGADDDASYIITDDAGLEIDGYSQCGADENSKWIEGNADIRIGITPANGNNADFGIDVRATNVTIKGLSVYAWNQAQINVEGGGDDATIQGNFIGLSPSESSGDDGFGLRIAWGAKNTLVGGPNPADRNVVSGNSNDGISIQGWTVTGVWVENNFVGVKQDGRSKAGNKDGIDVQKGPSYNTIINNVLSGNTGEGIELSHDSRGQFNYVIGNIIGPSSDGEDEVGNRTGGLTFDDSLSYNYIQDNIISGNYKMGVRFNASYYNVVENNMIGVSIALNSSDRRLVGFLASDYFDSNELIDMGNGRNASSSGSREPLRSGIEIYEVSSGNIIRNNIIANNPWSGIRSRTNVNLYGYTCFQEGNTFSQNRMYNNGWGGIDTIGGHAEEETLGSVSINQQHGPIPSGPPEHWPPEFEEPMPPHPSIDCTDENGERVYYVPNEAMQPPDIAIATLEFAVGTTCASCTVEIFIADEEDNDNGAGEGKYFIGSAIADGAGSFIVPIVGTQVGDKVTGTATNPNGSTSPFALNVVVVDQEITCDDPAPTAVTPSIAVSGDDVVISWSAVDNAATYAIYRVEDTPYFDVTSVSPYAQAPSTQLSFTDEGVMNEPDANYFYVVLGRNLCGAKSAEGTRLGAVSLDLLPNWNLLTLPLIPSDLSLAGLIGTQLSGTDMPDTADRIMVWNSAQNRYESAWYCAGACEAWGAPWANSWLSDDYSVSTLQLALDTGFWVQNRSGSAQHLTIVGTVPTGNRSVAVGGGWQLLGSPYPIGRALSELSVQGNGSDDPLTADRILYWDAAAQQYESAWYCGSECAAFGLANTWLDDGSNPSSLEIGAGAGFWYENRANVPFIWVNPDPN